MQTVREPARELPVWGEADVVVCGGGPSGFMAAVSAARAGARTLLVERYGFLGGTATAGCMVDFGSIHNGREVLVGGATHEFLHRLADSGGGAMQDAESHRMTFDPESMILVCRDMVLEAGVELLLHTLVVDVVREGDTVKGVVAENKSGRSVILGRVVVDATGDGDVAARAGADYDIDHEDSPALQPVTLEVILGGVDLGRVPQSHFDVTPIIRQHADEWPIPTERIFSWGAVPREGRADDPRSAYVFINTTNVLGVDGTRVDDLVRAEIEARGQVRPLIAFLRRHVPGFENCYLDRTGAQVGVRETRRICGDYTLTHDDVLAGRHFPDGVAPSCNSIDVHDAEGRDFEHEYLERGAFYEIPYRCFLPRGIEGLLVTGRAISADRHALGSARVMVVCMPAGDACGLAAAMAASSGVPPRRIDVAALRAEIRRQGTVLSETS